MLIQAAPTELDFLNRSSFLQTVHLYEVLIVTLKSSIVKMTFHHLNTIKESVAKSNADFWFINSSNQKRLPFRIASVCFEQLLLEFFAVVCFAQDLFHVFDKCETRVCWCTLIFECIHRYFVKVA
jgi:hypothetical protein